MTVIRISTTALACYGVCCPKHQDCARYAAVEGRTPDHTLGTCATAEGKYPLFQPKDPS